MRWLALLLLGCSGPAIDTVGLSPFEIDEQICGWDFKEYYDVPTEFECYLITPSDGTAVTPESASPCQASRYTTPGIFAGGQRLRLYSRLGTMGDLPASKIEPSECDQ